jgi:hypothetical protein
LLLFYSWITWWDDYPPYWWGKASAAFCLYSTARFRNRWLALIAPVGLVLLIDSRLRDLFLAYPHMSDPESLTRMHPDLPVRITLVTTSHLAAAAVGWCIRKWTFPAGLATAAVGMAIINVAVGSVLTPPEYGGVSNMIAWAIPESFIVVVALCTAQMFSRVFDAAPKSVAEGSDDPITASRGSPKSARRWRQALKGAILVHPASLALAFLWGLVFGFEPAGMSPWGPDPSKVVQGLSGALNGVGRVLFLHAISGGLTFFVLSVIGAVGNVALGVARAWWSTRKSAIRP